MLEPSAAPTDPIRPMASLISCCSAPMASYAPGDAVWSYSNVNALDKPIEASRLLLARSPRALACAVVTTYVLLPAGSAADRLAAAVPWKLELFAFRFNAAVMSE